MAAGRSRVSEIIGAQRREQFVFASLKSDEEIHMNGFLDRKGERLYERLISEIESDRKTIEALSRDIGKLRLQHGELEKKLERLIRQADEKRDAQRVEAISNVVKNDKSFRIIAIVTSALTLVAIVFAVLLALFWRK
jgi:FlaA1/EpsC-like NDP-sugar epimerase